MVDRSVHPTAEVAGRHVQPDEWGVGLAIRAADSTYRRRGGSRTVTAPCRGGIPVGVRIAWADGNCRPVVPARGAAAKAPRVGHRAGRVRGQGPSAPIDRTTARRARRLLLQVPLQAGAHHDPAERSRRAVARVPVAWGEWAVPASVSVARSRPVRGPSSRVPAAMRRRGRSLQISLAIRRRVCRPLSVSTTAGLAPSHPAARVCHNTPANVIQGSWSTANTWSATLVGQ
jgi:hypothetical protein